MIQRCVQYTVVENNAYTVFTETASLQSVGSGRGRALTLQVTCLVQVTVSSTRPNGLDGDAVYLCLYVQQASEDREVDDVLVLSHSGTMAKETG